MMKKLIVLTVTATVASTALAADYGQKDFGQRVEQMAREQSVNLFGTLGVLNQSSTVSLSASAAEANPAALLTVAPGLSVRVVSASSSLSPNIDQISLWPNDEHPTHLIACNEQGSSNIGVQSINIATGAVHTIIKSGLTSCDPTRRTPWGTIVVGEENGTNGRVFEIINPLNTTDVVISGSGNSTTITGANAANVAFRGALGMMSFEGMGILPNGVIYLTDENRPGNGNKGGGIFKFIPSTLWSTGTAAITNLANSPFANGSLWGMRVGRNSNNTDFGQGNEFGRGVWVSVGSSTNAAPLNLRALATTLNLTAYYRPEDMSVDQEELADGYVRFCGTNTGQDTPIASSTSADNHWGEVYCVTDGTVAAAASINTTTQINGSITYTLNNASVPEYHPLILGSREFAMPDNLDIQPGSGNFIVDEDGDGPADVPARNNDIFDCLDDGDDTDTLSDACVRVMSLNDLTAEPTGGIFDGDGNRYFVSIQHNITGHGVILEVSGWRSQRHYRAAHRDRHDHDNDDRGYDRR